MATIIFIILVSSGLIFVYESIIAPNFRFCSRYEFFNLRDRLIRLKIENPAVSDMQFKLLHESINLNIASLSEVGITHMIMAFYSMHKAKAFSNRIDKYVNIINSCDVPEYQTILKEKSELFLQAFIVNSLGLILLLMPVLILVVLLVAISELFMQSVSRVRMFSLRLILGTESEVASMQYHSHISLN